MSGATYGLQSRTSEELQVDDSGSGGGSGGRPLMMGPDTCIYSSGITCLHTAAEGRAAKRFQRSTSDGNISLGRPNAHISSTIGVIEPRSNFTSRRRQSTRDQRDQRVPLGPRPVEFSTGKRSVHQSLLHSLGTYQCLMTKTFLDSLTILRLLQHPFDKLLQMFGRSLIQGRHPPKTRRASASALWHQA